MASRRYYTVLTVLCMIVVFSFLTGIRSLRDSANNPQPVQQHDDQLGQVSPTGHAIAPKLGNETAKAELGRATWHFFHTVMARFPETPTEDESNTLRTFIHSFQRVYPCGECAEHFGELLKKFPPQTSSRNAAAGWACHVHNQVNKRLKKEMFDCNNIGDFYDCGCAEDEKDGKKDGKKDEASPKTTEVREEKQEKQEKPEMSDEAKEKYSFNGRDFNEDLVFS